MDSHEAKLYAVRLRQDLPTLDLHGYKIYEALDTMELFLSRCLMQKEVAARVVYGVGTGALHDAVIERLQTFSFVATIEDEGASCLLIFS